MIILTESYVNENSNPIAKYKAKKAAEAKAAEDAEVEKLLGKRPTVASDDHVKKLSKQMAVGGGILGAGIGHLNLIDANKKLPSNQKWHPATGAIGGGVSGALSYGALGYGVGKGIQKYQKHKQEKYDKKAEAIRASMRNK